MSREITGTAVGIEELREQMAGLAAIIERQQSQFEQQRDTYDRRLAAQDEEISALRTRLCGVDGARDVDCTEPGERTGLAEQFAQKRGRGTSRRRLLVGAGAAAAAAAVTLVANEQTTYAARADDTGNFILGEPNTATSQTSLAITGSSSASPFFQVDASGSTNTNAIAIEGISNVTNGYGVLGSGTGTGGTGVEGDGGDGGCGVFGGSPTGVGVQGVSPLGTGVLGFGSIDLSTGSPGIVGSGRIFQGPQTTAGAPTSGTYSAGDSIRDANGDLYLCVQGNGTTVGTWKKVTAIPSGTAGGALVFFSAPFRVYDTRLGVGAQGGGGPMSTGQIITVNITGVVDPANSSIVVPSGATGIIGDLIAIAPSGSGFLGIQPSTGSHNSQAWVNYTSGVTIHNSVVVGLSASGKVDVECSLASSGMGLTITGYII